MGMVFMHVVFDGRAPDVERIAEKAREICGLPLLVEPEPAEFKTPCHDMRATVAFAGMPLPKLELCSYVPGAVKAEQERTFGEFADMPWTQHIQGYDEPPGTQTVYIQGYVGQEPTLMAVVVLALEALGGRPNGSISDEDRRKYGAPVTLAELERRKRANAWRGMPSLVIGCILTPILLPFWILWAIVTTPQRIARARRLVEEHRRRAAEQRRAAGGSTDSA